MMLRCVVAAAVYVEISVGGRLSRHPFSKVLCLDDSFVEITILNPFLSLADDGISEAKGQA